MVSRDNIPAPHDCQHAETLLRIEGKLDAIAERLAKGDTAIALMDHRISSVEKVVYGLCGTVLLAVLGGGLALVVR